MLKPFDQSDAKKPARRTGRKAGQLSLFGALPPGAKAPKGPPLASCEVSFAEIAPLWSRGRVEIEALPAVRFAAAELSRAVSSRLTAHYAALKQRVGNALDIAAYFTLREVQDKAEKDSPSNILEALDFGVGALKGKE